MKFLVVLCVLLSGCSLGYRRVQTDTKVVRDDGRSIQVNGHADSVLVSTTMDFKYARLSIPFEGIRTVLSFESDEGGGDSDEVVKERRFFRLDAPLLNVFQPDVGWGFWYPAAIEKRKGIELWVGGELDFKRRGHRWVDLGLMYYHYNSVGFRLYGGIGSEAFRASTATPMDFVRVFDERAMNWGVGFEITVLTGEYFWELLQYFAKVDKRHQKRIKRNRY